MYRIVFCLIPKDKGFSYSQDAISLFASKINAPQFSPHVTFHTALYDSLDEGIKTFQKSIIETKKISLSPIQIEFSNIFTKSVFLSFAPTKEIISLCERAESFQSKPSKYVLQAHLSLTYTNIPISERIQLVSNNIKLPNYDFVFDEACAILTPEKVQTKKDVEQWTIVSRKKIALAIG